MNVFLPDPPRWKDRTDQSSLAERAAGDVVRGLASPAPLSNLQLARIKAGVSSRISRRHPFRFWVPVTAGLLLGGATAASAARLHLLPRWLTGTVQPREAAGSSPKRTSHARPLRSALEVTGAPSSEGSPEETVPGPSADLIGEPTPELTAPVAGAPAEPAASEARPEPRRAPGPSDSKVRRGRDGSGTILAPVDHPAVPAPPEASAKIARRMESPGGLGSALVSSPSPLRRSLREAEPNRPEPARAEPSFVPSHATGEFIPSPPNPVAERAGDQRFAPDGPTGGKRATMQPPSLKPDEIAAKPLAEAIRTLRTEHAPARALALLDAHSAELARGSLGHEALLVRVEALLALHRQSEVLRLLDATVLTDVAAARSLRIVRAELRAAAGRCAEALPEFDLLLARPGPADERALRGRAACQEQLGAPGGAGSTSP
jgi:hypothetical protein